MKKFSAFLLLVFISISSFSQENFIPGFIIRLTGDTTDGFIDYRNWRITPEKISFKETLTGNGKDYRPSQISGFSVAGRIYESAVVEVEVSPFDKNNLTYDPAFNYRTDTAFLQARFRGPKSLYVYVLNDYKEQYYIRTDTSFELLSYKMYLVETDNYSHIFMAENKKYIGQLADYLQDCRTLGYRLENTKYLKNYLDKVFLEYSKCTGNQYDYIRKKEEKRTEFGFLAGMSITKVNFEGSNYPYLTEVNYKPSYNFMPGIFFDFVRVKNDRKWSLSNELLISSYNIEGEYDTYQDEKNYTKTITEIGVTYLKWHLLGRYKFPVGKMFLFANAGPSLGLGSVSVNQITQYITLYGIERKRTDYALDLTKGNEFGFVAGIGARLWHFSLETRYEWGNGFSSEPNLTARTNKICFLLGYRF
jgi:hypothetical protein